MRDLGSRAAFGLMAILATAGVSSCAPDQSSPESVSREALRAMHHGDSRDLCELSVNNTSTAPAGEKQIDKCSEIYGNLFSTPGGGYEDEDPDAEIEVTIDDDSVAVRVPEWELNLDLKQLEDDWYIVDIGSY